MQPHLDFLKWVSRPSKVAEDERLHVQMPRHWVVVMLAMHNHCSEACARDADVHGAGCSASDSLEQHNAVPLHAAGSNT